MRTQDDSNDTASPFQGIIRSMVAIFLIPATQLIVSYMIDVGNSLTYEVKNYVNFSMLKQYADEQQYDCKIEKSINVMKAAPYDKEAEDASIEGKAYHGAETNAVAEQQSNLSKQMQFMYNFANYAMSSGLIVLAQFQLVMMCYLFLCGPVAAALYAWPNINKSSNGPGLFNRIFANWLDAVVVLSLWRFWWMVVLATMVTYIQWCQEMGWFDQHSEWEMMVFTSFQVLLMLAPFQPFNFNPKPFVEQVEKKAKEQSGGNQSPSADGKSTGGGGGATSASAGKSSSPSGGGTTTVSNTMSGTSDSSSGSSSSGTPPSSSSGSDKTSTFVPHSPVPGKVTNPMSPSAQHRPVITKQPPMTSGSHNSPTSSPPGPSLNSGPPSSSPPGSKKKDDDDKDK